MLAPAAAGSVLEMGDIVHQLGCLCFFLFRKVLFLLLLLSGCYSLPDAASASVPMAQMKPSSSRPTAVTIFL